MDEESQQQQPPQSSGVYTGHHATTAFAHVFFKALTIVIFLLPFWDNYSMRFIIVVLSGAVDFWVTKNVTGRVLVALRWWNHIKEDGETEWMFESAPDRSVVNACDSVVFWGMMVGYLLFWIVYTIVEFLAFNWEWIPATILMATLTAVNLYGYAKCKKDWKKQGANFMVKQAQENPELAMQAMTTIASSGAVQQAATSSSSSSRQQEAAS
eukprot:TRINITY_DN34237_c0_g1_i1.p1 TRINITY_DN34237_c0_g1~~TRINITY_DN34237_c0_g1_i1.p1  ORF type:complete len:211 (+),score=84.20 TRINITY_DN34237_c0_g1_i1:143-775(+)